MTRSRVRGYLPVVAIVPLLVLPVTHAQAPLTITAPKQQFGYNIGDDYFLANYTQLVSYWQKLDKESDRMILTDIGKTAEGRSQVMAIITASVNFKKLDRYKQISRQLALSEGLTEDQALALSREGKAVVWIDGGLHATEVLGAQQIIEMVYQMVSRTDAETMRLLDDTILLVVPANPDGMELVSNWYMRESDPKARSTGGLPRLYHKYIGHDDNRDSYMSAMPETTNMNRVMFLEWFPQIMYNHHQTGPAGAVLFAPPFRDPFNYNFDPLVPAGIDLVGAAMHNRFIAEGKPGAATRAASSYSTWWNGGLRTIAYFHNMIGLLTEAIGNPTPISIPFVPSRQRPDSNEFFPIPPQSEWHFRQSIEYEITANRAVLDVASRHREQFLFNIYQMGRNSIQRGSQDTWTASPTRMTAIEEAAAREQAQTGVRGAGARAGLPIPYWDALHKPEWRDPRGFIITADQPDFLTAIKFVNALSKVGISVQRATAPFTVAGRSYPAGSYVVKTAQAFRPHVMDMFEPQDHPNDFRYPGGPPIPPYDIAGWTLALQMGVKFDRILDPFEGPFERLPLGQLQRPPAGRLAETPGAAGYLFGHRANDAFLALNRLLAGGEDVYWRRRPTSADPATAGAFFVTAKATTQAKLRQLATDIGLSFEATGQQPSDAVKLKALRIGLSDHYGGSIPSGWIRWIFEQFEFPFQVVFPKELDSGDLRAKFDVLVFPDGLIPGVPGDGGAYVSSGFASAPQNLPPEFQNMVGDISVARTVPKLKEFLDRGGTIVTIGSSTALAYHLGLPVSNHLVEIRSDRTQSPLPGEKYYIPGSILQVAVDNTNPLAHGMEATADVFFDSSPVFRLHPEAGLKGVRAVAWFPNATPLRSGWAWGQFYLEGGAAVVDATAGQGRLYLLGPEVVFRSQPHGTYKLLFNAMYWGASAGVTAASAGAASGTR